MCDKCEHVCKPMTDPYRGEILQNVIKERFILDCCNCWTMHDDDDNVYPKGMCVCRLSSLVEDLSLYPRVPGVVPGDWDESCSQCYDVAEAAHAAIYAPLPSQTGFIVAIKRIADLEEEVKKLKEELVLTTSTMTLIITEIRSALSLQAQAIVGKDSPGWVYHPGPGPDAGYKGRACN